MVNWENHTYLISIITNTFELRSSDTAGILHWPTGLAYIILHYSWMSLLPWFTAYLSHTSSDPFTSQPLLHQNTKKLITKHPVSIWDQPSAFVQWVQCDSSVCFAKTMPHSSNSSNFIQLSLFCIHKKCKVWNANLRLQEVSYQLNKYTIKRTRLVNDSHRVH